MRQELEQKLFKRFKFFKPERPVSEALMAFGFGCGSGWFDLIWKLCIDIEPLVDKDFELITNIHELVELSIDRSIINPNAWREGIVIRLLEDKNNAYDRMSFKVVNPKFLLKYDEW